MDSQVEFLQVTIFLNIYIILYRHFHHFYHHFYDFYMLMGMDWGPILKQLELGFPVRGLQWTFFFKDQHLIEMPPLIAVHCLPPHVTNGG